ncbi:hypothetical protein NDU88_001057 [Pleurodeles waltl]|uniref:Uncharacterized protein n=1 Tax=Pleurodeles waltl TaxID=8319 RepID=A0AAV7U5B1_PLEWA|nr:hypothetical protein NDU88_001057 [Pleurodeles waltl]
MPEGGEAPPSHHPLFRLPLGGPVDERPGGGMVVPGTCRHESRVPVVDWGPKGRPLWPRRGAGAWTRFLRLHRPQLAIRTAREEVVTVEPE